VTSILIFETYGISGKARKTVGSLYLVGAIVTFVFGYLYAMITLNMNFLYIAAAGGLLMGVGALLGAEYVRKSSGPTIESSK
jgi:hypothetical protein